MLSVQSSEKPVIEISQHLVDQVVASCRQAGEAILTVYRSIDGIAVDYKADDSPLTQADLAAHRLLVKALPTIIPNLPLLSEEGQLPSFAERQQWRRYWLIDPLDGTKEFISRNGEFTVNVALIEAGEPVLGVVHVPVQDVTYTGARELGATKRQADSIQAIRTRSLNELSHHNPSLVKVVASRRHGGEQQQDLLQRLEERFGQIETVSMGSSLKFCLVAEGLADFYPRLAPTSEWDTAAAQAVVEAAGGAVVDAAFNPLRYNHKDDIINPHFYVWGDRQFNWSDFLQ